MKEVNIDLIAKKVSDKILSNLNPESKAYEIEKAIILTSTKICELMLKEYQEQLLSQK